MRIFCVVDKDQSPTLAPYKWPKGLIAVNEIRLFPDGIKREAATAYTSS